MRALRRGEGGRRAIAVVGRVALLLRSSLRAFDIGSARLRHRIEAGDIRISRYRFAEFVGKMHATVNDDVMTFCDFAVMVWPRPAHLGPHGAWLTNNQLGRWWWLGVIPKIGIVSTPAFRNKAGL